MSIILLVDDELENRNALTRALGDENPGWEIHTASGELDAMAILQAQFNSGAPIEVLLTDLVMDTEASGMRLIQAARKIDPLVMPILFTAKEKSLDRYAAFDYGAFDVVEKNIRGASAFREINVKARAALNYRAWSRRVHFMGRYFDPKVFEAIEKEPSLLDMASKTVSIVFWDIRGFSALCETLKAHPSLIAGFLRDYCETAARVIFSAGGVLDKFIGDGVMALFGSLGKADDDGTRDALAAVEAAENMRSAFHLLDQKWRKQFSLYAPGTISMGLGCGIHTGEVLVGNVGTAFRDQYTALGAAVNFASRIEGRSKASQILLSQPTNARVSNTKKTQMVGKIDDIKNIPGEFPIFELVE